MQNVLRKAAFWYISATGFNLKQIQADLGKILRHRENALENGSIEQIYKSFACAEIAKAAICLIKNIEYNTSFSQLELRYIRNLVENAEDIFTYPCELKYHKGNFPKNSKFCLPCNRKVITAQTKTEKGCIGGYINRYGAIICNY